MPIPPSPILVLSLRGLLFLAAFLGSAAVATLLIPLVAAGIALIVLVAAWIGIWKALKEDLLDPYLGNRKPIQNEFTWNSNGSQSSPTREAKTYYSTEYRELDPKKKEDSSICDRNPRTDP